MTVYVAPRDTVKIEAIRDKMVKTPASLESVLGSSPTLTLTDGRSNVEVELDNVKNVECANVNRVLKLYFIYQGERGSCNLHVPAWHEDCVDARVSMLSGLRERMFTDQMAAIAV